MELVERLMAVALVMGLMAAALWWLRRKGLLAASGLGARAGRKLELAERLSLGPQQAVCLVRAGDRAILLGVSPAGCQVLDSSSWSSFEKQAGVPGAPR